LSPPAPTRSPLLRPANGPSLTHSFCNLPPPPSRPRADTAHDYESVVAPLVARHPSLFDAAACGLAAFRAAASWVASRAFYVDAHHGGL
jgi:hypothetical protein